MSYPTIYPGWELLDNGDWWFNADAIEIESDGTIWYIFHITHKENHKMPNVQTREYLRNRYSYHPPFGTQTERYNAIREKILSTAELICDLVPDSRDRELALEALDEAMFRANAAIARNEQQQVGAPYSNLQATNNTNSTDAPVGYRIRSEKE